jgi:hypothetical protein
MPEFTYDTQHSPLDRLQLDLLVDYRRVDRYLARVHDSYLQNCASQIFLLDPVQTSQVSSSVFLFESLLTHGSPAVVEPASADSQHRDVVILPQEGHVESSLLGQNASVAEDEVGLDEDLGD